MTESRTTREIQAAKVRQLAELAETFAASSQSANTRRAYLADWQDFVDWTKLRGRTALPADPETVAFYLAELADAGKRPSTIDRRRSAISSAHKIQGFDSPTHSALVEEVLTGIRRELGQAQRGKAPAVTADIRAMVRSLGGDLHDVRDRAVILLGFAGAFRRSELAALTLDDIEECPEGLRVTIRRSKTDQEGKGRLIGIPRGEHPDTCPVRAYKNWLHAAGITTGVVFRGISRHGKLLGSLSDRGVARAVKHAAELAGLDPAHYSGHSLRAGLATSAASAGAYDRDIMQQTGHKRVDTLYRYIRKGNLFQDNVARRVGL